MNLKIATQLFNELSIPVLVCANAETLPVLYMNVEAGILFAPSRSVDEMMGVLAHRNMGDLLSFPSPEVTAAFFRMALHVGQVDNFACEAITFEGAHVPMNLFGNRVHLGDDGDCFVIYLFKADAVHSDVSLRTEEQLSTVLAAAFASNNVDDSIQTVLAMTGQFQHVSRAYIFEEISATSTRNTYEWCAEGVQPAIQDLQDLKKADYNYDVIVNSGYYITNDVRSLPDGDREILEMQGICSLAIMTLYDHNKPLGYVGFDDTVNYRVWSQTEIEFLRNIAGILASLIKRRNAEQSARRSQDIVQLMMDVSDHIVYANTLDDYTITFVNKTLADAVGKDAKDLLGKKCWAEFQKGQTGPCPFCPIPYIQLEPGAERSAVYTWETVNPLTKKTYLAKDSIVRWVDGQYVHVETAIDISARKDYEDQLQYFASTDAMTGAYNRNWGARRLEEMLRSGVGGSLVFVDIDGLKKVNDQYGHADGDELITSIVNAIRRHIHQGEVMCRWGGDEFLLWLNTTPEAAEQRVALIIGELEALNRTGRHPYKSAFSYGIVAFSTDAGPTLDALVTAADTRMYTNKMAKRGVKLNRRSDDPV